MKRLVLTDTSIMEANVKTVEVFQVYTATYISLRRSCLLVSITYRANCLLLSINLQGLQRLTVTMNVPQLNIFPLTVNAPELFPFTEE